MSLCSLCKGIPWDTLPEAPRDSWWPPSGVTPIYEFPRWPRNSRGYVHHQSFRALENSAKDFHCGLCCLILKQAEICKSEVEWLKPEQDTEHSDSYYLPTWEFWIIKRPNGDGIWVMTDTKNAAATRVRLVAAIGLCVRNDDPLKHIFRGRPVEQDGGSSVGISRVRNWVNDCNKRHNCRPQGTILPSRVIDVGDDMTSPYVKLRETGGNESGSYISLRYCWGPVPHFTTTKATLQDRKHQIRIADLPATQRDTIKLTSELGIQYLWIDSICICQDDHEDWERESAKMTSVYDHSYLTVAASKGTDSSEGLFDQKVPREYFEFECASGDRRGSILAFETSLHSEAIPENYITLPNEPLSERGWVLQERVLSRRTILYTTQQMCFECGEGFQGEDGLLLGREYMDVYEKPKKGSTPEKVCEAETNKGHNTSSGHKAILGAWRELLYSYGQRKLTHASDKLPAVSGLARIYAEQLGDMYAAGLWRSHLVKGLVWDGMNCRRVREYKAPSWSWASINGGFCYVNSEKDEELAEVVDVRSTLKGANPYGEVTDGRVQLRAPMESVSIDTEN
ncbi:Ff.00g134040.m01.CDS01 [Fusarium sp. VM40]|nr:Ff.00g134040.m01.CDS01 [Fusarium sp. VM40]